jgi:hypothetical protein
MKENNCWHKNKYKHRSRALSPQSGLKSPVCDKDSTENEKKKRDILVTASIVSGCNSCQNNILLYEESKTK